MRNLLLTSAAVLALAVATPASAQTAFDQQNTDRNNVVRNSSNTNLTPDTRSNAFQRNDDVRDASQYSEALGVLSQTQQKNVATEGTTEYIQTEVTENVPFSVD
jgi:hypothetical protein